MSEGPLFPPPFSGTFVPLPEGEQVVAMCEFKGTLFVATNRWVFRLIDNELVPIRFQSIPDDKETTK